MDVSRYLARIGVSGDTTPSLDLLCRLQAGHLYHIPYENLDIVRGLPGSLDLPALYEKIVEGHRGGYCFELNGLYSWLLQSLGFSVTELFGRFLRGEESIPKRRHRVLLVTVKGQQYLTDVGVGSVCPRVPLPVTPGVVTTDLQGERYRIREDDFLGLVVEEERGGSFTPYYSVTLDPQIPADFVAIDYFCRHAPGSAFRSAPHCAIQSPRGGAQLKDGVFRLYTDGVGETFVPAGPEEFLSLLDRLFGISLPSAEGLWEVHP